MRGLDLGQISRSSSEHAHVDARGAPIMGIDPGSRVVGYSVLTAKVAAPRSPRDFQVQDAGILRVDARAPYVERIGLLHVAVAELFGEYQPKVCVIEKAFCDKNVASALRLGEIRGAFIAAAHRYKISVAEITPAEVKKTITGSGRADKDAVSVALKGLMGFHRGDLPTDVTDALAISLCYALKLKTSWILA